MTTWNNEAKNSSVYGNLSKNVSSFVNMAKTFFEQFLLKQDGGHLLLQSGGRIILEQSVPVTDTWSNQSKS